MAEKCQKITNNCKISEITKYGEKITKMSNNVNKCQKMGLKRPKNGQISEKKLSSFFWLETTSKNGTSHFHTMIGSRDMHFM